MTHPILIKQLLIAPTPWEMPETIKPGDPSWAQSWATASEKEKVNLARGWLWCATEYIGEDSSKGLFEAFLNYMDDNFEWVKTIQPYLDMSFFQARLKDENWQIISETLVGAQQPEWEHVTLLHDFLFGNREKQKTALLSLEENIIVPLQYCPVLMVQQAWRIVGGEDSGELFDAAKALTLRSGRKGHPPVPGIPERAHLIHLVAFHHSASTTHRPRAGVQTRAELRALLHQQSPALAASLLLHTMESHVYQPGRVGPYYMKSDSFLVDNFGNEDPYYLLKQWIPASGKVIDYAQTMDVSPVEACALIAIERNPDSGISGDSGLPVDLLAHM